jgi:hypothetical protein
MPYLRTLSALWLCIALLASCQSAYYDALEQFGIEKRDLLVTRVEGAKASQQAAKEQFESALQAFQSVVDFEGGELEARYDELNAEYEQSEIRAEAVSEHIDAVEDVAEALFDEWRAELDEYSNPELRADSAAKLEATEQRYEELMQAMRLAEERMEPVLAAFRDQVLALKHNLNAQAIASLRDERTVVEADIADLIEQMNDAIRKAEAFLGTIDRR